MEKKEKRPEVFHHKYSQKLKFLHVCVMFTFVMKKYQKLTMEYHLTDQLTNEKHHRRRESQVGLSFDGLCAKLQTSMNVCVWQSLFYNNNPFNRVYFFNLITNRFIAITRGRHTHFKCSVRIYMAKSRVKGIKNIIIKTKVQCVIFSSVSRKLVFTHN